SPALTVRELGTDCVNGGHQTLVSRFAVEDGRARPACSHIANQFGSRDWRLDVIPQSVQQGCPRFDLNSSFLSVDIEHNGHYSRKRARTFSLRVALRRLPIDPEPVRDGRSGSGNSNAF